MLVVQLTKKKLFVKTSNLQLPEKYCYGQKQAEESNIASPKNVGLSPFTFKNVHIQHRADYSGS